MALALLALLVQDGATEDHVHPPRSYLMRHQAEDGSWGKRPSGCFCWDKLNPPPPDLKPDEATRRRVTLLIRDLGDDRIETRERAHQEILKTGPTAAPQVWESLQHPDPEVSVRCHEILPRIHPGKDEAKGDAATTGLAILAFLSMGYSHLSRDTYDGICLGDTVRRGLKWLMSQQNKEGAFSKDPEENILAALALSEAYGLTGSNLFKENAERGISSVMKMKLEKTKLLVLKGLVIHSAKIGGLKIAATPTYEELSKDLAGRQGDLALVSAIYFYQIGNNKGAHVDPGRLGELDPSKLDPLSLYLASWSTRHLCNRDWQERARKVLRSGGVKHIFRCGHGSWGGKGVRDRMRFTAYRCLAWESSYYRNGHFFLQ